MWKILVGFAVFAALALYVLSMGGDIDMGGEKHGIDHPPEAASAAASAVAPQAASAVAAAASALAPASAASN